MRRKTKEFSEGWDTHPAPPDQEATSGHRGEESFAFTVSVPAELGEHGLTAIADSGLSGCHLSPADHNWRVN